MNTLLPVSRMLDAFNLDNCPVTPSWSVTPHADVLEGADKYLIRMDLPGVRGKDLDISVEHQTLSVKAERSLELPEGFRSRRGGEGSGKLNYSRTFRLGNGVDLDGIEAGLEDGVLEIRLPKSEKGMARRIEVK